ncbi:MAG: DUF4159 domain-containing protein [Myxococcota bacterium]
MRPADLTRRTLLTGMGAAALCPAADLARGAPARPAPPLDPPLQLDPLPAAPGPDDWRHAPSNPVDPGMLDPFAGNLGGVDPSTITIDLPQLRYEGQWNPRAGAMRVLARELRLRTRLEPVLEPGQVTAGTPELFSTPFLYVAGEGELPPLTTAEEDSLRRFIDLGGLILFDAADGGTDPGFTRDVKALLHRIAPASEVAPVGRDHVLYRSFYLIDAPMGRTRTHAHVLGVQDEGRLRALVMRNDLGGALAETNDGLPAYPCTPGGNVQREWAIRFGVNILLYATCTDYKADRAHVETLLRSRRWR